MPIGSAHEHPLIGTRDDPRPAFHTRLGRDVPGPLSLSTPLR